MELKRCCACKEIKDISEFWRNRTSSDGLTSKCKICMKEYMKKYNKENSDKAREYMKKYNKANANKLKEYRKKYNIANSDKQRKYMKEYNKKYYEQNSDKIKESVHKWNADNLDKIREYHRKAEHIRRARIASVEGDRTITFELVYKRNNGICQICSHECTKEDGSIDHIVPISREGTHTWDNVQLAHLRCNIIKGTKIYAPEGGKEISHAEARIRANRSQ